MNTVPDEFHTRSDDSGARERLGRIGESLQLLGAMRLVSFLRYARDPDVMACGYINKALDEGAGLEVLAGDGGEWGYVMETEALGEGAFRIRFGCVEGREEGDGGTWVVTFDEAGRVKEGRMESGWIC